MTKVAFLYTMKDSLPPSLERYIKSSNVAYFQYDLISKLIDYSPDVVILNSSSLSTATLLKVASFLASFPNLSIIDYAPTPSDVFHSLEYIHVDSHSSDDSVSLKFKFKEAI